MSEPDWSYAELIDALRHHCPGSRVDQVEELVGFLRKRANTLAVEVAELKAARRLSTELGKVTADITIEQDQRIEALEEALRPFAYDAFVPEMPDHQIAFGGPMLRVGDYRRAVKVLNETI